MSANGSFDESEAPGGSVYIDGQALQDSLEAELQREEENQQKDLHLYLNKELGDLDFISNSEDEDEDSYIDMAFQHIRDTTQKRFETDPRLQQSLPPTARTHINLQSVPQGFNKKDQIVETTNQNQEYEHVNYSNMKPSKPHIGEFNHNYVTDNEGHQASVEECNMSGTYINQKQNGVSESHPLSNGGYQYSSRPINLTAVSTNQGFCAVESENFRHRFVSNQSEGYFVSAQTGEFLPVKRTTNEPNMDDEWMIQIEKPTVGAYHDHNNQQYNHVYGHQQLQGHTADHSSNNLQKSSTSMITNKHSTVPHLESIPGFNSDALQKSKEFQNLQQHFKPFPSAPLSSKPAAVVNRDVQNGQQTIRNTEYSQIPAAGDGQFTQHKVHYQKRGVDKLVEEDFYLDNECVEFFNKDGPEDGRIYEQYEVLYHARGREIEEMTRTMMVMEEEKSKEIRSLKHQLTMATGEAKVRNESLLQCEQILKQAKFENTDAAGKIRALETQISTLKNAKEEVIKKLQVAESTIENMTHEINELQNSESMSRARNEHEAVISSLTSRYEKELLAVKERLDISKTALDARQDELDLLKKQLADKTSELEKAQISRGDTINKLTRSLEDSQRQNQMLLNQSSVQELSLLKFQLQQTVASKIISEDLCKTFQNEIKDLKEQLSMLDSASKLGVFSLPSHASSAACHDDSMTDLGIRKTLNFDSPKSVAGYSGTPASDELIASLRSELEKCLRSNREKRLEMAEKVEEVKTLRASVEEAQNKIRTLEATCLEQKKRLQEVDSLNGSGDGVRIIEARLKRDIEVMKREKEVLLEDIEDYKKRLQEIGESEAKLTEINAKLSDQITQMVNDSDMDKRAALESCQRTLGEVSRMSIDKLRQEIEERVESEKTMLTEHYKHQVNVLKQDLKSALLELDSVKSVYVTKCEESAANEKKLIDQFHEQLEEELRKQSDKLELEKKEWERFMRDEMKKEQDAVKKSLREIVQSELKAESEKEIQVKVAQIKQAYLEEQEAVRKTMIDEIMADTKKQWQDEQQRDLQKWNEERQSYESELARQKEQISELKEKLDVELVSGKENFQKPEDLEQEFQVKLKSLEKQLKEEMIELVVKYDRERVDLEQKLNGLCRQFSLAVEKDKSTFLRKEFSSTENSSKESQLLLGSDLLEEVSILEMILIKKDTRIKELEKILENQEGAVVTQAYTTLESKLDEKEDEVKMKLALKDRRGSVVTDNEDNSIVEKNMLADSWNFNEKGGISKDKYIALEKMLESYNKGHNLTEISSRFSVEGDNNPEKLTEHIKQLELNLNTVKQKHSKDIDEMKQQHQKEFEKAARVREEKFQAELQYFLKEKENQHKTKLEKVMKECETKAKLELERTLKEKYELEIRKTICDYEKKKEVELQKVVEEYEERMKKEFQASHSDDSMFVRQKLEFEEIQEKMKCEINELRDKFFSEKVSLEKEMKQLKEEKNNEIMSLSLKHDEEKRKMKENLENELEKMKLEHQRIANSQQKELESYKSEAEATKRLLDSLKREGDADKKLAEQLEKEVEMLKMGVSNAQDMTDQIQVQRRKWFQDSQDYINKEIEQRVKDQLKEEQEKMKNDLEKIREWEVNKGNLEKIIQEKVQKELEMEKVELEREKKEGRRKVEVEIENLKKKFVSELEDRVVKEKSRLEQEVVIWKEETKKRMEEDRNRVVKMVRSDMERSLQEEKKRIEHEMNQIKENEMKDIREELEEEMRRRIQKERDEWNREKEEYDSSDNGSSVDWKERLQSEVDARTKACREREIAIDYLKSRENLFIEEKQKLKSGVKKCVEDLREMKKEHADLEEKYTEMDRKYKADMKEAKRIREQDLAKLKLKFDEEKEGLMASFKAQVVDLQDQYNDTVERMIKDGEREKLNFLMGVQKQAELHSLEVQIPDFSSSTILELRDQYLDAVSKIKADAVSHVQNANTQAAATMKVEICKQRQKVIEIFKTKCKANIRSALKGQVPETSITALEHSIDLISEHVITITTTDSGSATKPSKNEIRDKSAANSNKQVQSGSHEIAYTRQDFVSENVGKDKDLNLVKASSSVKTGNIEVLSDNDQLAYYNPAVRKKSDSDFEPPVLERDEKVTFLQDNCPPHQLKHHSENYEHPQGKNRGPHPQLEKVDLYDSDTLPHSPSSSNNSSPASQTRIKSHLKSAAMKHHVTMPDIPSLSSDAIRTRPVSSNTKSALKSSVENADFSSAHSPRNDMKVMEARVRLVSWTRNGKMPWKASSEKSSMKNFDNDGFVKPGQEAEQWLKTQRQTSLVQEGSKQYSDCTNNNGYSYNRLQFPSDSSDDATSSGTNTSFMTLEPEVIENSVRKYSSLDLLPSHKNKVYSGQKTDHFCAEKRDKTLRDTNNQNFVKVDQDCHRNFGSQESINSMESKHSPHYKAIPTSTPLVKGLKVNEELRTRSEGSNSNFEQWKTIAGTACYESHEQSGPELESRKHWKQHSGIHSLQPNNSPLKKTLRSRSVVEGNSENLVLKSAEFPSDLSRITQISDKPHYRYRSLNDLIPDHLQGSDKGREEMKEFRLTGKNERGMRDEEYHRTVGAGHCQFEGASQGGHMNQKNVDFMNSPDEMHAPVKAMNSYFWAQQSVDDEDRSTGQSNHRPFLNKQSDVSNFNVMNRSESKKEPGGKTFNKKSSPTRHKTSGRKRRQSPDYKTSFDTKERFEADSESRSEPQVSRYHLSQEKTKSSKYRSQDVTGDHRIQQKDLLSTFSSASSACFNREVTDLRRSLEELKPRQFIQQPSHRSAKNSKMTRSSSEQNLHTIHSEPQGQGHDSDIDALISTYTTLQSNFDLRPFPHDEQF